MVDFDFSIHGMESLDGSFAKMKAQAPGKANEELVEVAEELKDEIQKTAPYDTGEYHDSWSIEEISEDTVFLVNDADHAPHVVFPNPVMQGVSTADDPAAGILHNVRRIVAEKQQDVEQGWISRISGWLRL